MTAYRGRFKKEVWSHLVILGLEAVRKSGLGRDNTREKVVSREGLGTWNLIYIIRGSSWPRLLTTPFLRGHGPKASLSG